MVRQVLGLVVVTALGAGCQTVSLEPAPRSPRLATPLVIESAGGPFIHRASEIVLPATAGPLVMAPPRQRDQAGYDVVALYGVPNEPVELEVAIHPGPDVRLSGLRQGLARELSSQFVEAEVRRVGLELAARHPGLVEEAGLAVTSPLGPAAGRSWTHQERTLLLTRQVVNTRVVVLLRGSWFITVRGTAPLAQSPLLEERLATLLDTLGTAQPPASE
jgi:hypothetical protein